MATRQRASPTKAQRDAIGLLKKEHETVRALLSELERTTPRAVKKRSKLLRQIALEVQVHTAIEEEIFYPAFRQKGETQDDEKLFFEADEEHRLIHGILLDLSRTDLASALFSARAKVLKSLVDHHIKEEESALLPRARKLLSRAELQELAEKLEQRRLELLRHTAASDAPAHSPSAAPEPTPSPGA